MERKETELIDTTKIILFYNEDLEASQEHKQALHFHPLC